MKSTLSQSMHWPGDVLRRADWPTHSASWRTATARLVVCLLVAATCYGAAMGSFRAFGAQPQWMLQIAYSAIKAPLLLCGAFVISLPSIFVLSSLMGLRNDFGVAVRALMAAQAGLALTLASFGPLTVLWYASNADYNWALAFNGAMFAAASLAAQWLLRGYYEPLIRKNPRHGTLLRCWGAVYALVAIQLAWLLRPFVGSVGKEVEFLRAEAWDNAYVRVATLVWRLVSGE